DHEHNQNDRRVQHAKESIMELATAAVSEYPIEAGETPAVDITRLYLNEVRCIDLLSAEEELECSRKAVQGDEDARKAMIERNLRLVVKLSHRYGNRGLMLLDLI